MFKARASGITFNLYIALKLLFDRFMIAKMIAPKLIFAKIPM